MSSDYSSYYYTLMNNNLKVYYNMSMFIYKQDFQNDFYSMKNRLDRVKARVGPDIWKDPTFVKTYKRVVCDPFNYYGCLIIRKSGQKLNAFLTHSLTVDGVPTLPVLEFDPRERITGVGHSVDLEYEKKLFDLRNRFTHITNELNEEIFKKNTKIFNDELDRIIAVSERNMNSVYRETQLKNRPELARETDKIEKKYNIDYGNS